VKSTMTAPAPTPERTKHPFLTYDMIYDIPATIKTTLESTSTKLHSITQNLREGTDIYYTGCGTAFFSAMLGANILTKAHGIRVECVPALELANNHQALGKKSATLGVSHSGITKTTLDALRAAKSQGAYCLGVTHFPGSPISSVAHETLIVGDGPDRSRCHTKCYVAAAIALTQMGISVLEQGNMSRSQHLHELQKQLPNLAETARKLLPTIDHSMKELAEKHAGKRTFYFAGAGASYPNALEAALKMMETSYVAAQGFETEQLLHGPWVSLDEGSMVFVLATDSRTHERSVDLAKAAARLGSTVIPIVQEGERAMNSICDDVIQCPPVHEQLSPFLTIIPLYLFAYYMSINRGYNPDYLRYLTPRYWDARQIIFPPGTH